MLGKGGCCEYGRPKFVLRQEIVMTEQKETSVRELSADELSAVSGGLGFTDGGLAIMGLGFAGGPATAVFGLAVGGACLFVGYYQDMK